jgi:hypothetical protein
MASIGNRMKTFKRGQLVWAVWRAFSHSDADAPPKQFLTRVRKMGEFGVPVAQTQRPGQPGVDVNYTAEHAFELAFALKCLDVGLKQSEVAYFVEHIRKELDWAYKQIMLSPPLIDQHTAMEDRPLSPRQMAVVEGSSKKLANSMRKHFADTSFYITFRTVEIREAWGKYPKKDKTPFIYAPKFHRGLALLAEEMERLADFRTDDTRIVIELSNLAAVVSASLDKAPVLRRGRPS